MPQKAESKIVPANSIGILPLQEAVLFPHTVIPLAVVKKPGIQLVEEALREGKPIGLTVLKDREVDNPGPDDVSRIGTIGVIQKMLKVPDGTLRCIVAGQQVFKIEQFTQVAPYMVAAYAELPDVTVENEQLVAMQRNLAGLFQKLLSYLPQAPREMEMEVQNITDPSVLTYFVASTMRLDTADRQALLEERDTAKRMRKLTLLLTKELEVVELGHKIQSDIQREMEKNQREFYLRQQLRAIQEELGEVDPQQAETNELREKIEAAKMPEDVKKSADRELDRLSKVPQASPEYSVIRTYLDWLVTLPWNSETADHIDIAQARKILDEDHYDLEKIKDRIIEYLAVGKLKKKLTGPILCFVGPPGVGKTSLGQSIARAMGRKFVRLSVGGVRDEAEIRGHRRTYIGAMPGTIVRAIRDAGTRNPVMMIDEIDKVGADFRGDPQSALLEVLDPEQNVNFRDHYLDLPFDLSSVLFICTANNLDTISPPLRDRMEIIQLSGYTELEKMQIAKRYLIKKQRKANGLKETQAQIADPALRAIVTDYTREAGVRNLEREIGTVFRKIARKIAESPRYKARVKPENLVDYLSRPRFYNEVRKRTASVGVSTGMFWTPVGGDILFIETQAMPGTGKLVLTGQLGDVMKESAQAAVSFLRSRSSELELPEDYFAKHDVHVHVPAGATPKDGPSAGIALATAIASTLTGLKVDPNLAMTGEITLTGQVLPIGGLKEKVLGAKRAGIAKILLPKRNEPDLEDIPKEVRDSMTFVTVEELSEVLHHALGKRLITPVPLGAADGKASNVVPMRRNGVLKRVRPGERKRRSLARKR
ncbi:MAG: endopeptidase La [Candidatus Eremiobacteraeota bacterium]|nr:endopeptidase La [Candidatus Eremiobacteraeota bacterium]MBV8433208.1 endopeptidase La [Candidatus Eremiobacteraeota bacterium]